MKKLLLTLLPAIFASIFAGAVQPAGGTDDIDGIIAGLTLEEKASMVVGWKRKFFPPTNSGFAARTVPFPSIDVPSLVLADGTAGVRLSRHGQERATAFPADIALASSWDVELSREVGDAVGYEAKAYDVNVMLAPGLNILRNPLGGRNFEYFSEDPVLSGKMAAGYVKGIQDNGIAACAKHFTCNNQETNRSKNDVRISERALREIYLRGFEICVKESDPWTVMSSYNKVAGVPVQETPRLLTGILRDEWGFKGLVMTDWTTTRHDTQAQLHAGNDLFMPGDAYQVEDIVSGIKNGTLAEADLDRACRKVIELSRKCRFEPSPAAPDLSRGEAVSFKAACESSVLLENRDMLPLATEGTAALFGVRSYNLVVTGSGAGFVVCPHVTQINTAFRNAGTAVDAELEDLYTKYVAFASADIEYNEKVKVHIGLPLLPELEVSRKLIEKAAERDAYAVVTIGRTAEEGKDRRLDGDYYLCETEKNLIRNVCDAFHAKGKKVAVVLNIPTVIEVASWKDLPDAVLNIWLPGQEGGAAVHAILSGKVNPSGRLPITFPNDYYDCPGALDFPCGDVTEGKNYDWTDYSEGIYVGYRHYCTRGVEAAYPFGYGLSYTTFGYSALKVKSTKAGLTVSFTVTNIGGVTGRNAVGIYVSAPEGGLDKPAVELKAFAKTHTLAPGQSESFSVNIPSQLLASFNEAGDRWETAKGKYTIILGTDATQPALSVKVNKK